jgi:hypothetical protein
MWPFLAGFAAGVHATLQDPKRMADAVAVVAEYAKKYVEQWSGRQR